MIMMMMRMMMTIVMEVVIQIIFVDGNSDEYVKNNKTITTKHKTKANKPQQTTPKPLIVDYYLPRTPSQLLLGNFYLK